MQISKLIQEKSKSIASSIKYLGDDMAKNVTWLERHKEILEKLPCVRFECECDAEHFPDWDMSYSYSYSSGVGYSSYGSRDEAKEEANKIRSIACRALGVTVAKRKFFEGSGDLSYEITSPWQDMEGKFFVISIANASLAPSCELVPVKTRPTVTTYKLVCPEDRTVEEIEQVAIE